MDQRAKRPSRAGTGFDGRELFQRPVIWDGVCRVFFLLAARGLWHGHSTWPVHIVMALGFLLIGLFRPALLAPLNKIWTKLGSILGKIVSPIVLGGLFFLVIAPAALIFRALGKDLLNLRRDPGVTSYWLARNPPGPAPESINDQF